MTVRFYMWLFLCSLSLVHDGFAHDGLDGQIAAVSAQIAKEPAKAGLFIYRGGLYRLHGQTNEALADFAIAERIAPDSVMPGLGRAELFFDGGRMEEALREAEAVLTREPFLSDALIVRARCRVRTGSVREAVEDYSLAILKTASLQPDIYLERARLHAALGRLADAVTGLDEGMAKIGAVPGLQRAAIDYERQQAKFDAALARIQRITETLSVKESWILLRGEILAQAGRNSEARAAFESVLAGIGKYSSGRRDLDQTKELETRARKGLALLEGKLAAVHP